VFEGGSDDRGAGSPRPAVTAEKRSGATTRAGSELRKILEQLFRQPRAERSLAVTAAWSRAVGPRMAQVARPIRIVDKKLLVQVASPTWRTELQLRAKEILGKLRRELGDAVRELDVRVGVNVDLRRAEAPGGGNAREALPGLRDVARTLESPELRAMALALAEGRPLEEARGKAAATKPSRPARKSGASRPRRSR
jgi:hypothetical protein